MNRNYTRTVPAVSMELPLAIFDYFDSCLNDAIERSPYVREILGDAAIFFSLAVDELKRLHADATEDD
jgi:hypothetical protein